MSTISQPRSEQAEAVASADVAHLLHPWGRVNRQPAEPLIFKSARGVRMTDIHDNEWIDAAAGLLNVTIGYGRSELADAAADALRELSYGNLFFGRGSVKTAQLAAKLAEISPPGVERFFFTYGGSDANDSLIKFARYYNFLRDKPEKIHVIGRTESYHGMSLGAWSMTGDEALWERFGPRLAGFSHIAQPGPGVGAEGLEQEILRIGPDKVALFVAEPISMPARINIPPDEYWPAIREICTKYDVLLSVDEVITGFGRTGKMFASEHWALEPDFIQMSKGITSGYMPLGALGVNEQVAEVLDTGGDLFHGFTAGGHTAACAVALVNIEIMEREDLVARGAAAGDRLRSALNRQVVGGGLFTGVRGLGNLTALDVDPEVPEATRARLGDALLDQHMLVRPYDDWSAVGFAPSLAITDGEVDEIVANVKAAVASIEG
jgi:adenosylmethionine-8-amino-7-oxononanoate aminotransferase